MPIIKKKIIKHFKRTKESKLRTEKLEYCTLPLWPTRPSLLFPTTPISFLYLPHCLSVKKQNETPLLVNYLLFPGIDHVASYLSTIFFPVFTMLFLTPRFIIHAIRWITNTHCGDEVGSSHLFFHHTSWLFFHHIAFKHSFVIICFYFCWLS